MTQYHVLVCPSRLEAVDPERLLGLGEAQATAEELGAALAALIAEPADDPALAWWPRFGRWTGECCAIVGSYAEDGDTDGALGPIPESLLFRAARHADTTTRAAASLRPDAHRRRAAASIDEPAIRELIYDDLRMMLGHAVARLPPDSPLARQIAAIDLPDPDVFKTYGGDQLWEVVNLNEQLLDQLIDTDHRLFRDLSVAVVGLLESTRGLRTIQAHLPGQMRPHWTADQVELHQGAWRFKRAGAAARDAVVAHWRRYGVDPGQFCRPPASGIIVDAAALATGPIRMVANLDRQEYFAADEFGHQSTLAAILAHDNGAALALAMLVTHPADRGSGDWPDDPRPRDERLLGRWRGDRLAILPANSIPPGAPLKPGAEDIGALAHRELPRLLGLAEVA
jgi:hypothetical protein